MRYVYRCQNKHEQSEEHGMLETPLITCRICRAVMWRKPQPFTVNWNGPKPSAGGVSQFYRELEQTRPERLDSYQEKKAK